MKRYGYLLASACLAAITGSIAAIATAAEPGVLAQDLGTARASGKVLAVLWTRRSNSFTLQVVLDGSRYQVGASPAFKVESDARAALARLQMLAVSQNNDRSSVFIGNTIASLRCLDPAFTGRRLSLVDGRRTIGEEPPSAPAQAQLSKEPLVTASRPVVQVWLLRADGTLILPTSNSLQPASDGRCPAVLVSEEMLYRFPFAESGQAVAVAIQIDDQYYIEKLQPLVQ